MILNYLIYGDMAIETLKDIFNRSVIPNMPGGLVFGIRKQYLIDFPKGHKPGVQLHPTLSSLPEFYGLAYVWPGDTFQTELDFICGIDIEVQ